jgi:hypothetical protein
VAASAVRLGRHQPALVCEHDGLDAVSASPEAATRTTLMRGLRERADTCGGRLDAGPTSARGWLLSARLPRRAMAAP